VTARGKARKRALDVLFEADQRGLDGRELLAQRMAAADPPVPAYTVTLVQGVSDHRERLDELIASYAEGWSLGRMPAVDRALLRLAGYELLYRDDVPDAVAIDEAVRLASELSTESSAGFVNGLLARLLDVKPSLAPR
jgi:N utilization substance protein B